MAARHHVHNSPGAWPWTGSTRLYCYRVRILTTLHTTTATFYNTTVALRTVFTTRFTTAWHRCHRLPSDALCLATPPRNTHNAGCGGIAPPGGRQQRATYFHIPLRTLTSWHTAWLVKAAHISNITAVPDRGALAHTCTRFCLVCGDAKHLAYHPPGFPTITLPTASAILRAACVLSRRTRRMPARQRSHCHRFDIGTHCWWRGLTTRRRARASPLTSRIRFFCAKLLTPLPRAGTKRLAPAGALLTYTSHHACGLYRTIRSAALHFSCLDTVTTHVSHT